MANLRKMAIDQIMAEGVDMTEENIQAVMKTMKTEPDDAMIADHVVKTMQSLREKSDVPRAIQALATSVLSGMRDLATSFREHGHEITVNPAPINIEKGETVPTIIDRGADRPKKMRFIIQRDMNGFMESVQVIEDTEQ